MEWQLRCLALHASVGAARLRGHTITAKVTDSPGGSPVPPPTITVNVVSVPGDMNGDGGVEIKDLLLLQQDLSTP